jgi:hypothetical protein
MLRRLLTSHPALSPVKAGFATKLSLAALIFGAAKDICD